LEPRFSAQPSQDEISRARVFEEPLVPIGRRPSPEENRALSKALVAFLKRADSDDTTELETFLATYPASAWRRSLLLNLGIVYQRTGHLSKALSVWRDAWENSKGETEDGARAVADRALAELAGFLAGLGRADELRALLPQAKGRNIRGSAGEAFTQVGQALGYMESHPERAFRCGPLAVQALLSLSRKDDSPDPTIASYRSTSAGTSLLELKTLSERVGLKTRLARRVGDSEVVLPALVQWKMGHFATLIRARGERYLVRDQTMGSDTWITRRVLNEEATGYSLILDRPLPKGWEEVSDAHARGIWGAGATFPRVPAASRDVVGGNFPGEGRPPKGLPYYRFHTMLANLNIQDWPLGYDPPVGPRVEFLVTYNHKENFQPQVFSYSNLGPKWTFDWMSWVRDDPTNPAADVDFYLRGGGWVTIPVQDPSSEGHPLEYRGNIWVSVTRTSTTPIQYERHLPDGSVETFSQPDGAMTYPRKVFLTSWSDPQGNTVRLTFDANLRIVAATDAIGQVTTVSYEDPREPLRITKVTDPFGRSVVFEYNPAGELAAITDVIGMRSEFTYSAGDFLSALTIPYGTWRFKAGNDPRCCTWVQATDPLGGTERLESWYEAPSDAGVAASDAVVPRGFESHNHALTCTTASSGARTPLPGIRGTSRKRTSPIGCTAPCGSGA
jgi:YD repeat-containing protein